MATFDFALGMDHSTLDHGVAQLFNDKKARETFFKGEKSGKTDQGLTYDVSFDIGAAPQFSLAPDDVLKALWPQSIDIHGKHPSGPLPAQNLFILTLPEFSGDLTVGTAPKLHGSTANVRVFSTLSVVDGVATLAPQSIWIDEAHFNGWDKFILNGVVLPAVLTKAQALLAGLKIPKLSFSRDGVQVDLMPPDGAIVSGLLILASSLPATGKIDLAGAVWPTKALFVLASGGAITSIAQSAVDAKLVGHEFPEQGNITGGEWDAEAKVNTATVVSDAQDRTKLTATIGFGLSGELKPLGIGGPCAVTGATSGM